MARFEDIKSIINTYIKPNGKEEITGEVLQNVLRAMMEAVDIVVDEVVAAFPQISGSEFVDVLENKVSLLLDPQGHLGNTGRGLGVVMDKVMSDDSLNPVSNKVVKAYVDKIKSDLDALVGGDLSSAIDNFNEILEFLSSIEDSETLSGIIAGLETSLKKYADGVAQAAYEQSYSDSVGASSAYTDGKISALAAVARTGSYNDLKDKPTIPTGGGGATPRVEMTAESAAIEPNKFYVWPMMDALDITLGKEQSGVMNKYFFQFRNPKAGLTMLTLPDDITWSEDTELDENGMPVMEAAAFYRIEIIEGLASLKKWKLVYINFADAEVERVLMANGVSSDGIGITKKDARLVKTIGVWFKSNTDIKSFKELRFFESLTMLGNNNQDTASFNGCTNLQEVEIPTNVRKIGPYTFANCDLRQVPDLSKVTQVHNSAFSSNANMRGNLRVNGSVGQGAFYNTGIDTAYVFMSGTGTLSANSNNNATGAFGKCINLKSVTIGEGCTLIRQFTFWGCESLQEIICLATTPPTLNAGFTNTPFASGEGVIYVPDTSVEAYKTAQNWNTYAARVKGISDLATDNPALYAEIEQYL